MSNISSSNRRASAPDGSLYAVWDVNGQVIIRNRAWQIEHEGKARDQSEFDALCQAWGLEVKAKRR